MPAKPLCSGTRPAHPSVGTLALMLALAAQPGRAEWQVDVRAQSFAHRASSDGPLSAAQQRSGGHQASTSTHSRLETEIQNEWTRHGLSLAVRGWAWADTASSAAGRASAAIQEWSVSGALDTLQGSVGRKVISWDVGYAFRPNDLVQQENRQALLPTSLRGVPLMELEHFDATRAYALVWANPHHLSSSLSTSLARVRTAIPDESALAARAYWRLHSADAYGFARWGQHTRGSVGAAWAWVPNDNVEVHASGRLLQRHVQWTPSASATVPAAVLTQSPWTVEMNGPAHQQLWGIQWTGAHQQSALVEWWYDGTALSNAEWRAWADRQGALSATPASDDVPAYVLASNLAWQATPLNTLPGQTGLRRNNLLVRLAWQPTPWLWGLDHAWSPSDRGHITTASAQWQADRSRWSVALRRAGGPSTALASQLPHRHLLALSWQLPL